MSLRFAARSNSLCLSLNEHCVGERMKCICHDPQHNVIAAVSGADTSTLSPRSAGRTGPTPHPQSSLVPRVVHHSCAGSPPRTVLGAASPPHLPLHAMHLSRIWEQSLACIGAKRHADEADSNGRTTMEHGAARGPPHVSRLPDWAVMYICRYACKISPSITKYARPTIYPMPDHHRALCPVTAGVTLGIWPCIWPDTRCHPPSSTISTSRDVEPTIAAQVLSGAGEVSLSRLRTAQVLAFSFALHDRLAAESKVSEMADDLMHVRSEIAAFVRAEHGHEAMCPSLGAKCARVDCRLDAVLLASKSWGRSLCVLFNKDFTKLQVVMLLVFLLLSTPCSCADTGHQAVCPVSAVLHPVSIASCA